MSLTFHGNFHFCPIFLSRLLISQHRIGVATHLFCSVPRLLLAWADWCHHASWKPSRQVDLLGNIILLAVQCPVLLSTAMTLILHYSPHKPTLPWPLLSADHLPSFFTDKTEAFNLCSKCLLFYQLP